MALTDAEIKSAFPGTTFPEGAQVTVGDETYTMGKDGSFAQADAGSTTTNKLTTPPTWDGPEDARKLPGAGKYPNFYVHKSRSGHTLIMDDSKGAEHVTLQHRGGSMVQLQPDGKLYISAQNGQYNIVFGENRMKITGAHDITVDGAASLKINKDYNLTVGGDVNMTATGNFNMTAQNFNVTSRGNVDIAAKNMTGKFEGSVMVQSKGAMTLSSKGGFLAGSSDDSTALVGKNQVAINADQGEFMVRAGKKISMESTTGDIAIQTLTGKFSVKGMQGIMYFLTSATMESVGATTMIAGAAATIQAGGAASLAAGGEVSVGAGGGVSIAAAGAVGLAAGGAIGLEAAGIGLDASLITSVGIIQQNSGYGIAAPIIPPTPAVPQAPISPDNPKQAFNNQPADTTTVEDSASNQTYNTEIAGYA